jgi:hypothetical protein
MQGEEDNQADQHPSDLEDDLRSLATLNPSYTRLELEEARARLHWHFDMVWSMFVRLETEGKLDSLPLTDSLKLPTVKAQKRHPSD